VSVAYALCFNLYYSTYLRSGHSAQSDEEEDYYDAIETTDTATEFTVNVPISAHRRTSSGVSTDSQVCETVIQVYIVIVELTKAKKYCTVLA